MPLLFIVLLVFWFMIDYFKGSENKFLIAVKQL